jgi:hypothetical protein
MLFGRWTEFKDVLALPKARVPIVKFLVPSA